MNIDRFIHGLDQESDRDRIRVLSSQQFRFFPEFAVQFRRPGQDLVDVSGLNDCEALVHILSQEPAEFDTAIGVRVGEQTGS